MITDDRYMATQHREMQRGVTLFNPWLTFFTLLSSLSFHLHIHR